MADYDANMAPRVRDTLFALIATYLSQGTQNFVDMFPAVPKNAQGQRIFQLEGDPANTVYIVAARAPSDAFLLPGVNVYFGDDTPFSNRVYPQKYVLPMMVHVNVPWTDYAQIGERTAMAIASLINEAFEDLGGSLPVYDFSASPPAPVISRSVSWGRSPRMRFTEAGNPLEDDYTNRVGTREVRYEGLA